MYFGRGKPENIKIEFAELDHKTSCKNLGVNWDKKLKFYENNNYVVKKLVRCSCLIYRIRNLNIEKVFWCFTFSVAKSIFWYGLLV